MWIDIEVRYFDGRDVIVDEVQRAGLASALRKTTSATTLSMPSTISNCVPKQISRGKLDPEIAAFLKSNKLTLGGKEPFTDERRHHTEVLAVPPPSHLAHVRVEPLIVPGPVSDLNVRCYHPSGKVTGQAKAAKDKGVALIYIHGGGWTVGSLPEFDTFFRIMAEEGGVQVYALEYHLAPEFKVSLVETSEAKSLTTAHAS